MIGHQSPPFAVSIAVRVVIKQHHELHLAFLIGSISEFTGPITTLLPPSSRTVIVP
jgi:hypothetical protein